LYLIIFNELFYIVRDDAVGLQRTTALEPSLGYLLPESRDFPNKMRSEPTPGYFLLPVGDWIFFPFLL
jgi:hypothetical protein